VRPRVTVCAAHRKSLLAGLWPRIPTDRIAQLAGVSEPVRTEPATAATAEDLSAIAVDVVIEVPREPEQVRVRL